MSSDAAALAGREREIEVVRRFLEGAAVDGRALLITGPAGTGRTAVLDAAVAMASAGGAWVATAAGGEDEADLPFAGLSQVLAPLDGVVERLDPGHRAVLRAVLGQDEGQDGQPVGGGAVVEALIAALEAAAGARPVVVAIDDLPMMDAPSVECLRALARQLPGRRIGLLATARTAIADSGLAECHLTPRDEAAATAGERRQAHARVAYVHAAVGGDLDAVAALLDLGRHGALWAAAARGHLLLHGDGDLDAAHRVLVDAVEAVGVDPEIDPAALTAALDTLLMVCRVADRTTLWSPLQALAARHTARIPADLTLAVRGAGPTPADPVDPAATVRAGWSLLAVDRLERCVPALRRVLDDGLQGGAAGVAINAAVLLTLDAAAAGRWDDTVRLAQQGRALCTSHGHEAMAMLARAGPALVAACRGDEATCRDHTSAMIGWAAPRGARLVHHHAVHARVLAALGQGDAETAFHQACTVARPGVVEPGLPGRGLVLDLVEAAVRTGRHDEAAAHVRAAREAGIAEVSVRAALVVAGSTALAEQGDRARTRYEQALAVPGAVAWPFDLARVRLAYGEHLRRSRATLAARLQLTTALATFRRLGADPWIARAESELRAAGHRTPRARGPVPTVLSHQERTVARLAATGATNRQIGERLGLSPRTVGSHLTRAFQKLGVTSRAALGAALRARDQD